MIVFFFTLKHPETRGVGVVKEVVERVLQIENDARQIVDNAKKEAREKKLDADNSAAAVLAAAKEKAVVDGRASLDAARKDAEFILASARKNAETLAKAAMEGASASRQAIAIETAEIVIGHKIN